MTSRLQLAGAVIIAAALLVRPSAAFAHCDALDGPVVKAAERALETGAVAHILIWVPAADEGEIQKAFADTLAVRALSAEAKALADRYFFETVVRVHRAGEGAPFTGLKPAGRDLGPAIPAADQALERRDVTALRTLLGATVDRGLSGRFRDALAARDFALSDIARGREFVRAYGEFLEYVERLYEAAAEK